MKEEKIRIKIPGDILFLLGAVSSIQLLSIGGITVYNILLVISAIAVLICERICLRDKWVFLILMSSIVTVIFSQVFENLTGDFRRTAFISGITFVLVVVIYGCISGNRKTLKRYIDGFDFTCKLSIVWCYLQVFLYRILKIDLNTLVFKQILGVEGDVSCITEGDLIPTGFYSHRGYMIPILIYSYFRTQKIGSKLLIVLMAFMTKSAAVSIGMIACIFCEVLYRIIGFAKNKKVKRKTIIAGIASLIVVFGVLIVFSQQVGDTLSNLFFRITSASKNIADNSSTTHYYYYKNFGNILSNLNPAELLFGTGFGISGLQYTLMNGQYADFGSWVVESDLINIFINQGIVGFSLWLYALIRIIALCFKKHKYYENAVFIVILLGVGVMYNIQFGWFLMVELCIYALLKKDITVFSWNTNSNRVFVQGKATRSKYTLKIQTNNNI